MYHDIELLYVSLITIIFIGLPLYISALETSVGLIEHFYIVDIVITLHFYYQFFFSRLAHIIIARCH